MYFEITLVPKEIIIEAENEDELKEILKRIPMEKFVWSTTRMNKEKFKTEMKSRYVYLKI